MSSEESIFDIESLKISKPKKHKNAEVMICKIRCNGEPVILQFPKMKMVSSSKFIELEFTSKSGYSKKVFDALINFDKFIVNLISIKSEEWFGKVIPEDKINVMYNKFVNENNGNTVINLTKSSTAEFIDNQENVISELVEGMTLESIAQLKHLIFTKDSCFVNWEIQTGKVHKKVLRVPKFGFINEDSSSDDESDEILTFF
jgi:hypothetical protein